MLNLTNSESLEFLEAYNKGILEVGLLEPLCKRSIKPSFYFLQKA